MIQSNSFILDSTGWTFIDQWHFSQAGIDAVFLYPKGTLVTWQEATVAKFGVVGNIAYDGTNTTVTLMPNSSYLLTTNPDPLTTQYAYGHPEGFPTSFAYPVSTTEGVVTTAASATVFLAGPNPNIRVGMEVSGTSGSPIPAGVTVIAGPTLVSSVWEITLSSGSGIVNGSGTLTFSIFTGFSSTPVGLGCWWRVSDGLCTVDVNALSAWRREPPTLGRWICCSQPRRGARTAPRPRSLWRTTGVSSPATPPWRRPRKSRC